MLCRDVMNVIEKEYPLNYALSWDNVGLLVGRDDKEVKKIYIALDATDEVIDEAVKNGADMLITHHPMIFKAMKKINDEDFIGRRVLKLIRDDISYYAMHTNYDVMGMAELAAEKTPITKADLMEWGLAGGAGSSQRRQALLRRLDLPEHLTANGMLEALNLLTDREELAELLQDQ
mgnify:CR=1 FL=1